MNGISVKVVIRYDPHDPLAKGIARVLKKYAEEKGLQAEMIEDGKDSKSKIVVESFWGRGTGLVGGMEVIEGTYIDVQRLQAVDNKQ
ncbi:hypothetical protein IPA_07190 [Ignicoccus pacificus DSM 13166]|uniref:Uncharacterized protein n=1 Tax=Ignicoccus pacificus DSM 13166 TaxID=940294 RepID=A0A977KBL9_9CREN|nr:hypothetical protein IPA_07190 [Ignicoccus pacificus DSM 13166]